MHFNCMVMREYGASTSLQWSVLCGQKPTRIGFGAATQGGSVCAHHHFLRVYERILNTFWSALLVCAMRDNRAGISSIFH